MRVMVLLKADSKTEAGVPPDEKLLTAMGNFNEELVKAGVMLAGDGLHPSSKGVRVRFTDRGTVVTDGPFTETKELVCGYWLWKVNSRDEAVAWIRRAPFGPGADVEIRPVFESEEFGEELTPETRAQEARLRAEIERTNS